MKDETNDKNHKIQKIEKKNNRNEKRSDLSKPDIINIAKYSKKRSVKLFRNKIIKDHKR